MNKNTALIVVGLLALLLAGWLVVGNEPKAQLEKTGDRTGAISFEEQQLIEEWIFRNNLNQYGDIKDMVYMGGTPLFNERTGQSIDRYEYILKRHSDRPWKKYQPEADQP